MAVRLRNPPEGCIFHSDRGSQYCAYDYQKRLQKYKLTPSMSGKGNCYDNASVEACPMIPRIIGCCALQDDQG
jgi:putative transposase